MKTSRRIFLKGTLAGSMVAVAAGAGMLVPTRVLAAWSSAAFESKDMNTAIKELTGTTETVAGNVKVKAPDIAENGSVVPITVESDLESIESISIFAKANVYPLAVNYDMTDAMSGYVSTRIKMGKTSEVVAIIKAGGKVYSAKKSVKVTLGGCGG
jgi:sulfur-oxidizing protein SoxY